MTNVVNVDNRRRVATKNQAPSIAKTPKIASSAPRPTPRPPMANELGEVEQKRRTAQPTTFRLHDKMQQDLRDIEQRVYAPRMAPPMPQARYQAGPAVTTYRPAHGSFGGSLAIQPVWLVAIMLLAIIGVATYWSSAAPRTTFSNWTNGGQSTISSEAQAQAQPGPATPAGQHSLVGVPSLSATQIDAVLSKFGSPAAGTGAEWLALGRQYNIDPAYALAFFIHESSAGTNPNWAGLKGGGSTTHNVGNIICAGYATCYGRFRDYPDWQTGIGDWYRLIRDEYVQGRGVHTLEQIIPIYAPSTENNVPAYVQAVETLIKSWQH